MFKNLLPFFVCFLACLFGSFSVCFSQVILDFEAPATSTTFEYFGSTLGGSLTQTIANPSATGINPSANVLELKEAAGAEVWAGCYSKPNPATPINLISGGLIKVKFRTNHVGNLVVKLEDGQNGGPVWAVKVDNAVVNEWVELVFNPELPSFDPPFLPAKGFIYSKIVLFADFGNVPTADQTYYIDDVQVAAGGPAQSVDVKFRLDMNQYSGAPFSKAYVSGTFNTWSGDANPLSDLDGDKIYETTISMPVGLYEYKFTLDNWAQQEQFAPTSACTKTTINGADVFTNRKLAVSAAATVGPICFNSCYSCGGSVKISVNLGMNGTAPNAGGVFLAGGLDFANPGGFFKMTDTDGDGVFSIQIERQKGYSTYYDFANGPCADYACKEKLTGQPCAVAANFDDRWLPPVTKDTTINTCFETCATNTNCTTGSSETAFSSDWLSVRPTLATDVVQLVFAEPIFGKADIRIFDAAGKQVFFVQKSDVSEVILPVGDLQNGLFFLLVKTEKKAATGRFLKM